MKTKPSALPVLVENIPDDLKALDQWVVWRFTFRKGKWTKPPFNARTGASAKSTDPATWSSFDVAAAAYRNGGWDGIGFVFSADDDYAGVDLDGCRDPETGELCVWTDEQRTCKRWRAGAPEPAEILRTLDSYAEVSPSGTGIKIIVQGTPPRCGKAGCVEMYDRERYFTITGHRIR